MLEMHLPFLHDCVDSNNIYDHDDYHLSMVFHSCWGEKSIDYCLVDYIMPFHTCIYSLSFCWFYCIFLHLDICLALKSNQLTSSLLDITPRREKSHADMIDHALNILWISVWFFYVVWMNYISYQFMWAAGGVHIAHLCQCCIRGPPDLWPKEWYSPDRV